MNFESAPFFFLLSHDAKGGFVNALVFSSIQSAAYGNLFECSAAAEIIEEAVFSSMSHENQIAAWDEGSELLLVSLLNTDGLKAKFPQFATEDGLVIRHPKNDLTSHAIVLGEIFRAAATLPPDPEAILPDRTSRQSVVKTRLGQHKYKVEQLDLWGGACAVTGIREPSLLRASHAKPWSDPTITDAERLDPANGLPLVVHLDALFDAGWISFADDGTMLVSPHIEPSVLSLYSLTTGLRLRTIPSPAQAKYLSYHRNKVFRS